MGAPIESHEHPDDAVLVRKAQEGDVDAFESLVRRYQQPVYAVCRRLTAAHQSADDLAQETFVKAYFALATFDSCRPFFPWLRKIAVNASLNYLKSRRRERPLDDGSRVLRGSEGRPAQDRPEARFERAEFEARFERSLAALPEEQRSVFVLRFYEGLSYEEMARMLDVPHGTVMSRLNRARRKLKALLADSLGRRP
jgi:RNA polymerase sigma-70 factor (ECF subfamily)